MRSVLLLLLCIITPASNAEGFLDRLGGAKQPVFLPPDQAFALDVSVRDAHTLQANFTITPGYYLYRDKISFTTNDTAIKVASVKLPRGEIKNDPNFGATEVFHNSFQAEITLERGATNAEIITLNAKYMGCSEQGLCYPPITPTLRVSLPDAKTCSLAPPAMTEAPPPAAQASQTTQPPLSEGSQIAKLFKGGNFWLIVS